MNDYLTIHSELANPIRMKLVLALVGHPKALADLSLDFSISKPEISRHLSRLIDVRLVERDPDEKRYNISPLGEAFVELFAPAEFVLKHANFFVDHPINLPVKLAKNIDALSRATLITELGNVLFKVKELLNTTERSLNLMIAQRFPMSVKKEAKVNYGKYIVPPSIGQKESIKQVIKLYEHYEIRFYTPVNHTLFIIDEKAGMISFPNRKYEVDFSKTFLVEDKVGLNFLTDIWDYFWNQSKKGTLKEL